MLQAQKLAKVEKMAGAEMKEEGEPEGEMLVGPGGEALRPPCITMLSSPTHFLTFFSECIWATVL